MARWSASISRSMWRYASRLDGRQARPRRSSTAKAPRARKKGALLDPQGFVITGRKRHIIVDTLGLLLAWRCMPPTFRIATAWRWCSIAARVVCFRSLSASTATAAIKVRRPRRPRPRRGAGRSRSLDARPLPSDFEILPKRWIVERTLVYSRSQ